MGGEFDSTRPFFSELADEHRDWLAQFDSDHLQLWERLFKSDAESALCEAGVRRVLTASGAMVSPGEELEMGSGGPDFHCRVDSTVFYVESTCICTSDADRLTGFKGYYQARRFRSLNNKIFKMCRKKAGQCGTRDAPVLLAIGTFSQAAVTAFSPPYPEQLLTGIIEHSVTIDRGTMEAISEDKTTSLRSAPFFFNSEEGVADARASIAGLLLCGLRFPGFVVGVLNPHAAYPFDSAALPKIAFSTVLLERDKHRFRINPNPGEMV